MRIYSKTVFQWQGDELVQVADESESYEYDGPVDLCKGGSSGPENYENLERLYGIQADQAEFLGKVFKEDVAPAYKGWLNEAKGYGSTANQELMAEKAGKAVSGATSQQQRALEGNMASMGINPTDQRYQQGLREMGIQGGAQQAAAETTARENTRNQGFARMQDAISMGMGTPTQASQAAAVAGKAADASLSAQNQASQNQANAAGNLARAGFGVYNQMSNPSNQGVSFSGMADGGEVGREPRGILRLKHGGYVQRLAGGGFAGGGGGGGFMSSPQITAPSSRGGGAPPSPAAAVGSAAASPMGMRAIQTGAGKAIEMGGNAAGSQYASSLGKGLQMNPANARAGAQVIRDKAAAAVDKSLGSELARQPAAPGTELGTLPTPAEAGGYDALGTMGVPAEAGGADALGTAAADVVAEETAATLAAEQLATQEAAALAASEGLVASGAGMGTAAAVGTAVPVIGAGLALYGIGNAAGWWADGGEVTPGSQDQTGEVDGPGGPKDDEILAALSDGEFVMPVGAVKFFGIDRMEKMRQKGLEHEQQMGIR